MNPFRSHASSLFAAAALLLTPLPCHARLGETAIQCSDRYGVHKTDSSTASTEKSSPVLRDAIQRTYAFKGWRIRAAFLELGGPCVRIRYARSDGGSRLQDFEVEAILSSNSAGGKWSAVPYKEPGTQSAGLNRVAEAIITPAFGSRMWRRSDGALAWLQVGSVLRLDLPAAQEHEAKLRQKAEETRRASVPGF